MISVKQNLDPWDPFWGVGISLTNILVCCDLSFIVSDNYCVSDDVIREANFTLRNLDIEIFHGL